MGGLGTMRTFYIQDNKQGVSFIKTNFDVCHLMEHSVYCIHILSLSWKHAFYSQLFIADVEIDYLKEAPALETIDLRNNPIAPRIYEELLNISNIRILLSPREKEDWEDLTI